MPRPISYAVFCLKKKKNDNAHHGETLMSAEQRTPSLARLPCHVSPSVVLLLFFFFFNDTPPTEIYTLSLHDALPISFLKASHSFRNRLLVICKNAYLFATMIMTSVSSPFSCCSGIVRLNLM